MKKQVSKNYLSDKIKSKQMDLDSAEDMLKDLLEVWDDACDEELKPPRSESRCQATDDMAQRIMDVLCENGQGDFLLIQDDEIRTWWESVIKERKRIERREAERRRRDEVRERALSKLTAEERKILGLGG